MTFRRPSLLPGFGLSVGYTLFYLGFIVLLPLCALLLRTSQMTWGEFVAVISSPRALASYRLSFGASLAAAATNAVFGLAIAWVLVRYRFPGRAVVDALVDLPFALPTAVAGISLTSLYSERGLLGAPLSAIGIKGAYSAVGVAVALTFIGLPFVVRTVQPVLEQVDPQIEEAASTLGASRWVVFRRVILPLLTPALITGFTLAFARALGEYGSVVFISGNMPLKTEIVPLLIMTQLEQFNYAGATALAVVMLATSFALLLVVNGLQTWMARRKEA